MSLRHIQKIYPVQEDEGTEKKKGLFSRKKRREAEETKKKFSNLKITDEGIVIVDDFNLEIADREFIVFVGPSGCGKSTTLRMIAGLEDITRGELYLNDRLMNDVEPKDRDIAMVFQNYALYPHMTVRENLEFPLDIKGMPQEEMTKKWSGLPTSWASRPTSTASRRPSREDSASVSLSVAPSSVTRSCS